jgi:hypothetical protein
MALSERVRRHLQSHVVAYLALFVALSGTALALPGKNRVKSNDIARGAVKGKSLADAAVARAKIRDGAVISAKLDDAAVLTPKLADAAVTSPKLAEDSVTRGKIAQGTIIGGKLANGAVDSAKVADGSLLADDFAPGQLSDGFVITPAGSSGSFTTPRAGRVFVTATFVSTCAAAPCADSYVVQVEGADVPGAALTRPPGEDSQQLTLIGLTTALPAGTHPIALEKTGSAATETQVTLGGVLLQ